MNNEVIAHSEGNSVSEWLKKNWAYLLGGAATLLAGYEFVDTGWGDDPSFTEKFLGYDVDWRSDSKKAEDPAFATWIADFEDIPEGQRGENDNPDGDGLTNIQEFKFRDIFNPSVNDSEKDSDSDGIKDVWEIINFDNLTTANATSDYDKDGLTDIGEFTNKTNPKVIDTDGDGIEDGTEVEMGLDPLVVAGLEVSNALKAEGVSDASIKNLHERIIEEIGKYPEDFQRVLLQAYANNIDKLEGLSAGYSVGNITPAEAEAFARTDKKFYLSDDGITSFTTLEDLLTFLDPEISYQFGVENSSNSAVLEMIPDDHILTVAYRALPETKFRALIDGVNAFPTGVDGERMIDLYSYTNAKAKELLVDPNAEIPTINDSFIDTIDSIYESNTELVRGSGLKDVVFISNFDSMVEQGGTNLYTVGGINYYEDANSPGQLYEDAAFTKPIHVISDSGVMRAAYELLKPEVFEKEVLGVNFITAPEVSNYYEHILDVMRDQSNWKPRGE